MPIHVQYYPQTDTELCNMEVSFCMPRGSIIGVITVLLWKLHTYYQVKVSAVFNGLYLGNRCII